MLTLIICMTGLFFWIAKPTLTKEIDPQNNKNYSLIELQNNNVANNIKNIKMNTISKNVVFDRGNLAQNIRERQTDITIDSSNFDQPHWLKINSLAKQMSGEITVNGRVIRKLSSNKTQINLVSYLSKGKHRVEISLNYVPAVSFVSISFSAPEIGMIQQSNGGSNGSLKHNLSIIVE